MNTYIIGIAGTTGSGKSTFSDQLEDALSAYQILTIHMDDYYKAEAERPKITGIFDGEDYIDDNHPMALDLDQCCIDIQKAQKAGYDILIVEGIFAFYDQRIFEQLHLKIFVDCDPDKRFARRIYRHLSFGESLDKIVNRYVEAVQPRQKEYVEPAKWKADMILNGASPSATGLEMVVNWVKTKLT